MKSIPTDHCSHDAHNGGSAGIGAGAAAEAGNYRNTPGTLHRVREAVAAAVLVVGGMDIRVAEGIPRTEEVAVQKGSPEADGGHVGTL